MAPSRKQTNAALEVNIMRIAGDWAKSMPGYTKKISLWAEATLPNTHGSLSVVLADDAFVRDLNHTYRGKNQPTNVLSFTGEGEEIGDVVLAYETVKGEAKYQKKHFAQHAAHLIIHGCLHLIGYDHENSREADIMEALETGILSRLGFPNPYKAQHGSAIP